LEWQNASTGFNVTSLLRQGVNISLSIQVSIADEFSLKNGIQISIDDVQLWISYVEEVYVQLPPPPSPPPIGLFIILGGTGGVLITGFVLYETVLKYPAKVRNIRSLRRKVRRGTTSNPIHSKNSQSLSKNIYETEKSHLDRSMKSPASKAKSPSSTSTEKVSKSYEDPAKITKPELTKQVEKIKKPEGEQ
jgi:hypothetical protein